MPRYRFGDFILSPRRRVLLRLGQEQPLIPRYFDLLVFLIARRADAVHRQDIFDEVWKDVIVSDSALSQAIRTLRRTLGDDSREPRFIRTVSRHGYRFVHADVVEEPDDADAESVAPGPAAPAVIGIVPPVTPDPDRYEALLARIARPAESSSEREEQREAAELLHTRGTSEALRRLGVRPGHPRARALLRDARWDVPGADTVPLLGAPGMVWASLWLVELRLRRAARIVASRWASAALGAGIAGLAGGALGGVLVATMPGSTAPQALSAVLALIGGVCGAAGGAGVSAGLSIAEATARSWRRTALVCGAALGGGASGLTAQWLGHVTLATLVGVELNVGGAADGVAIGAAAGLAYASSTPSSDGGLAAPRGSRRWKAILLMTGACGLAAFMLTSLGRPLVGGTVHMIATASSGARATLTPLGALVGEPDFGPLSRRIIGTGEGALFGLGLALGLTRRPKV